MRTRARRLARLEQLVEPYRRRQKAEDREAKRVMAVLARYHAMALAAVWLYGEPKLNEPLKAAWERCRIRFPGLHGTLDKADIGDSIWLLEPVLKELPGETERQKFQHVLDTSPHWLLYFTAAPITASILKLECPDLARAPPAGRNGVWELLRWPRLPHGSLQAGGPLRPVKEEMLTDAERRELHAEAAELIEEARSDCIKQGVMPGNDPTVSTWIRKNRRGRR